MNKGMKLLRRKSAIALVVLAGCSLQPIQFDTDPGDAVVVYQKDEPKAAEVGQRVAQSFAEQGWSYSLSTADNLGAGGTWLIFRSGNEKAEAVSSALTDEGFEFRTLIRKDAAGDVQVWVGREPGR